MPGRDLARANHDDVVVCLVECPGRDELVDVVVIGGKKHAGCGRRSDKSQRPARRLLRILDRNRPLVGDKPLADQPQCGSGFRPAGEPYRRVLLHQMCRMCTQRHVGAAAGIQDITNAMVEDFKLTDVLRMILETMYRALEFDRIIFCMRDAKTDTVTGRFGLGLQVEQYVKTFKVPLKAATPDLFAVVCNKGADTLISDASETRIVQRLPDWYRKGINAPTFLLLPLHIKGAPFGLIYADKGTGGALELDEKSLSLLRTLRNQAVMAFKQSS